MLLYFLLFQFLMQMHIQKNPFKTLFCLFEHSNQPDNSLTNSVGLEWGYLMSQPIAERGSIWGNQKQYFCNYIWNDTLQLQVNLLQNNYKQLLGWFPKMCLQNNQPDLSTSSLSWGCGYLISQPMAKRGSIWENVFKKCLLFLSFHLKWHTSVLVKIITK